MTMVSHPDDVVQPIETAAQAARMPARMRVCYEAGPTGYELQRLLASLGVAWDVVAPSPVPVASGDRVKTDRRDSRRLVRLCRAAEAVAVRVPTSARSVAAICADCRARPTWDRRRARQRLRSLLLRRGVIYRDSKAWTLKHRQCLIGSVETQDHPDSGQLSRSVRVDETSDLAGRNAEGHAV